MIEKVRMYNWIVFRVLVIAAFFSLPAYVDPLPVPFPYSVLS